MPKAIDGSMRAEPLTDMSKRRGPRSITEGKATEMRPDAALKVTSGSARAAAVEPVERKVVKKKVANDSETEESVRHSRIPRRSIKKTKPSNKKVPEEIESSEETQPPQERQLTSKDIENRLVRTFDSQIGSCACDQSKLTIAQLEELSKAKPRHC